MFGRFCAGNEPCCGVLDEMKSVDEFVRDTSQNCIAVVHA